LALTLPYANPAHRAVLVEGLTKAGYEIPPSPSIPSAGMAPKE